jgi:hypothetical protein
LLAFVKTKYMLIQVVPNTNKGRVKSAFRWLFVRRRTSVRQKRKIMQEAKAVSSGEMNHARTMGTRPATGGNTPFWGFAHITLPAPP